MTEVLEIPSAASDRPVSPETAIFNCTDAWTRLHQAAKKSDRGSHQTRQLAADAYCRVLPPLSSLENVRAFVACVAHGLAAGVIESPRASRLLYAAQVSKSVLDTLNSLNRQIAKAHDSSRS
jgi:hypothetical protein